jgi:uncharacterized protein (DUF305 family)
MTINYKILSFVLGILLLICMFFVLPKKHMGQSTRTMHQMPDGSMMTHSGNSMMDMTMTDMVDMMKNKSGKALEKEFIAGMIPHHQGAVDMAKLLLQDTTIHPEIKAFAENIIKAQESEINMMNEWLKSY